jgi:uncharacterized membrane protein (DUF4010 family)
MTWQEAGKTAACAMFDALRSHPKVAPLLAEDVPIGPNAMAAREALIAMLLDNGFPPALAARSYAMLARYVLGFAIQLTGARGDLDDAGLARVFHDLDSLPVPLDDEFEFGLELIIDGLTQMLARNPRRRKAERRSG